jgi:putative hydrolase of the HAD superfamily
VAIETCLFDMGNVLVFFCHNRMCRQMGALCGCDEQVVRERVLDTGIQWSFERGELSEDEFHQQFEAALNCRVDRDELLHANANIFTLNESIVPVLDELKSRRIRLVLLSNTSVAHIGFIRRNWDVLDRFDDFILSCDVKSLKPDAGIYTAALAVIGCDPSNCFYTDDIPAYIEAGRRHGLQAEVFTDTQSLIGHLAARGVMLNGVRRASA